jgi:hypothetical protein
LSNKSGDLSRSLLEFYSRNSNLYLDIYNKGYNPETFNESISYIKQYAGNVFNLSKKNYPRKNNMV